MGPGADREPGFKHTLKSNKAQVCSENGGNMETKTGSRRAEHMTTQNVNKSTWRDRNTTKNRLMGNKSFNIQIANTMTL